MKKFILLLSVAIFACTVSGFSQHKAKVLSVTDFETLVMGDTAIQVIDIRTPEEFKNGHIVRAQNMAYNDDDASIREIMNRIDKKRPVAIYCSAGAKSKAAADRLCKKGVKVYLLDKGVNEWRKERKELLVTP